MDILSRPVRPMLDVRQTGATPNLTITAGGGSATVTWNRPDEEEFQAFLVDLRPFISEGEPVFLRPVYNLIELHITDPELREEARRSRNTLRDYEVGADLHLRDRSPAQIADAYIDGTFHVDPVAREQSARPAGSMPTSIDGSSTATALA